MKSRQPTAYLQGANSGKVYSLRDEEIVYARSPVPREALFVIEFTEEYYEE